MTSRRSQAAPLALCLCLAPAFAARLPALAAGAAPAPPTPAGEVFGESIDVDVVNVQVFVDDRAGRPVAGLGRGDFELRVDGKPVPITNFSRARPPTARRRREGVHEGKVEIFLGARDSTGHDLRMRRITFPVRVPDGELAAARERRAVAYRLQLELPPGSSTIALGVRDELGGRESTVSAKYIAGALATARAAAPRPGPPRAR